MSKVTQTFFLTDAGRKAEVEALHTGRNIKVTSVVVDELLLPESQNPEKLTKVQRNPSDQNGEKAIYPIAGGVIGSTLTIAWSLPANSGGYECQGLGFILEDGTLWGYMRAQVGWKPNPSEQALYEPKGTITHKTSAAPNITVDVTLTEVGASIDDIRHHIAEHELDMRKLMRKMEGKMGRVRLYMAERDVDEEYLPIRGQTLLRRDYPDYFKHLGITADRLVLPDWSTHPYIRQFSGEYEAGATLEDQIRAHAHSLAMEQAGGHTPTAEPLKLDVSTGELNLSGKFATSESGSHSHVANVSMSGGHSHSGEVLAAGEHTHSSHMAMSGGHGHEATALASGEHAHNGATTHAGSHEHTATTSEVGDHHHTKGDMNIKGSATHISETFEESGQATGAFKKESGHSAGFTPEHTDASPAGKLVFNAADAWTGKTSGSGAHKHTLTTNRTGSHYHDFTTLKNGEHTHGIRVLPVDHHRHSLSIAAGGTHQHGLQINKVNHHSHRVDIETSDKHQHIVDVNFKHEGVSVELKNTHVKLHSVDGHTHKMAMGQTGGDETRPSSTVAVYAVKVKYLVQL